MWDDVTISHEVTLAQGSHEAGDWRDPVHSCAEIIDFEIASLGDKTTSAHMFYASNIYFLGGVHACLMAAAIANRK